MAFFSQLLPPGSPGAAQTAPLRSTVVSSPQLTQRLKSDIAGTRSTILEFPERMGVKTDLAPVAARSFVVGRSRELESQLKRLRETQKRSVEDLAQRVGIVDAKRGALFKQALTTQLQEIQLRLGNAAQKVARTAIHQKLDQEKKARLFKMLGGIGKFVGAAALTIATQGAAAPAAIPLAASGIADIATREE